MNFKVYSYAVYIWNFGFSLLIIQVLRFTLIVEVDYVFIEFIQQMSDHIPSLRDVVMDIISAIDRFMHLSMLRCWDGGEGKAGHRRAI